MTTLYDVMLPNKTLWSHSGLARQIGTDRKTIRTYVEKVAPSVLDFRKDLYRTPDGGIAYNMPLSEYQAWVLCQLIFKGKELRETIKGLPIHNCVKSWAINNAVVLSKAAWQACNDVKAA